MPMAAWRDDLDEAQRHKIAPPLAAWLDGPDPGRAEPQTVAIWARRLEELLPEQVEEFVALGLDAEEDMLVIPGTVTREQLLAIVRHPEIIAVNPVGRSQPLDPAGP